MGKDFSSIDSVLLAFQSMAVYKTRNDMKNRSIHSPYLKNETFCNKAVADPDLQISKGGGGGHPDPEIKGVWPQKIFSFGPSGLILV